MKLFILTGPAGAGKNTVAQIYAKRHRNTAVIDVDVVRWMVLNPHLAPWDGKEGKKQQRLGVKNACMLAQNFIKENFNVLILDVGNNETAKMYKKFLDGYNPQIILLMPTYEEMMRRNKSRPPRIKQTEVDWVYDQQKKLTIFDDKIDNTNLEGDRVVEILDSK